MQQVFVGGYEWTLISASSGVCAVSELAKPTVRYDNKATSIKVFWQVKESNRLTRCPSGMFVRHEVEALTDDPDN
jgi:hypothetical protein